MKLAQKYSHLNGEEYLIVHQKKLYNEIKDIIKSIDAEELKTKISKEKTKKSKILYSPAELNKSFDKLFSLRNWKESRYQYYITLNRELMEKSVSLFPKEQKEFLIAQGFASS